MLEDSENSDSTYTLEQKIVAAVWVHERFYNDQTWKDINTTFRARFGLSPPSKNTFRRWEDKLFNEGNIDHKERLGRPLMRLMHVPYVKASLEESPNLSLRERAKILGLPRTTLLKIFREDLNMQFEVENKGPRSGSQIKHVPYNNGKWRKNSECSGSSIESIEENASI